MNTMNTDGHNNYVIIQNKLLYKSGHLSQSKVCTPSARKCWEGRVAMGTTPNHTEMKRTVVYTK